jgi:hypothetical protein
LQKFAVQYGVGNSGAGASATNFGGCGGRIISSSQIRSGTPRQNQDAVCGAPTTQRGSGRGVEERDQHDAEIDVRREGEAHARLTIGRAELPFDVVTREIQPPQIAERPRLVAFAAVKRLDNIY